MNKVYSAAAAAAVMVLGMSFSAKADVSFCVQNPTSVYMSAMTTNEVGIVIAPQNATANPTVAANNYYGMNPQVSSYWKQSTSTSGNLPSGCYIMSISAKANPPDGKVGNWICAATQATQSLSQLSIVGNVTYPNQQQPTPVAAAYIIGPTYNLNTNAGNVNCPPPGQ